MSTSNDDPCVVAAVCGRLATARMTPLPIEERIPLRPGELKCSARNVRLVAIASDSVVLTLHDRARGIGGAVHAVNGHTSLGWSIPHLAAAIDRLQSKLERLGSAPVDLDARCAATPRELLIGVERLLAERGVVFLGHATCSRGRPLKVEFEVRSGRLRSGPRRLSTQTGV